MNISSIFGVIVAIIMMFSAGISKERSVSLTSNIVANGSAVNGFCAFEADKAEIRLASPLSNGSAIHASCSSGVVSMPDGSVATTNELLSQLTGLDEEGIRALLDYVQDGLPDDLLRLKSVVADIPWQDFASVSFGNGKMGFTFDLQDAIAKFQLYLLELAANESMGDKILSDKFWSVLEKAFPYNRYYYRNYNDCANNVPNIMQNLTYSLDDQFCYAPSMLITMNYNLSSGEIDAEGTLTTAAWEPDHAVLKLHVTPHEQERTYAVDASLVMKPDYGNEQILSCCGTFDKNDRGILSAFNGKIALNSEDLITLVYNVSEGDVKQGLLEAKLTLPAFSASLAAKLSMDELYNIYGVKLTMTSDSGYYSMRGSFELDLHSNILALSFMSSRNPTARFVAKLFWNASAYDLAVSSLGDPYGSVTAHGEFDTSQGFQHSLTFTVKDLRWQHIYTGSLDQYLSCTSQPEGSYLFTDATKFHMVQCADESLQEKQLANVEWNNIISYK